MSHMTKIRVRITELRVPQQRVAQLAGYSDTAFSRILGGSRPVPADFGWRVEAVLGALQEAQEAHDRTLADALERKTTEHELLHRKKLHEADQRKGCCETPRAWAEERQPAEAPS